jgi:hypothetical protein
LNVHISCFQRQKKWQNRDRKKPNYFGRPKSRQIVRDLLSSRRFSEAPFVNRRQPENNISYCNELLKNIPIQLAGQFKFLGGDNLI